MVAMGDETGPLLPIEGLEAPHGIHGRWDILERHWVGVAEHDDAEAAEDVVDNGKEDHHPSNLRGAAWGVMRGVVWCVAPYHRPTPRATPLVKDQRQLVPF